MADDKTLTLSTLFRAAGIKEFEAATARVRSAVVKLNGALSKTGKAAGTAKTGMSQLQMSSKLTQTAFKGAIGESTKFKQALSHFSATIPKTTTAFTTMRSTLDKVEKAIHTTGQRMTTAGKKGSLFAGTANRISLANQVMAGKLKITNAGFQRVVTAAGGAEKATGKASKATAKLTKQYDPLTKQIAKVHGGMNRLKAAFKVTAAYGIAATAIYAVIGAMKAGVSEIINYDQALKNLQAITGATDAETRAMGETIQTVARTTKFSTTEVADGMVLLGQAGFDAGESINAMQATADLATGTLSNMQVVTDLLTTTIRAFNLDTIESGRVADVMANAINKSKLTVDKLRIAFNYIAATASQAGLSLEETAATMMTLANNGLRASTIGTGLRRVLSALIAPNRKVREAFQAHGIALDKLNPATVGWTGALENLTKVLYNSETKTVDMSKAFELFQLRGAQAAAIIVKSYLAGDYQSALEKVYEIGTAAGMAAKQKEGLAVQIKNLVDRAKLLALAFGDAGVTGILKGLVSTVSEALVGMAAFLKTIGGQAVVQVVALTAAFAGTVKVIALLIAAMKVTVFLRATTALAAMRATAAGLATTMSGLTGKWGAFVTAVNYLGGPILWISAAIAGLLVLLRTLDTRNKRAAEAAEQAAVKFKMQADILELYGAVLKKLDKNSIKYIGTLKRFEAENETLAKRLRELTGVLNLYELSVENITDAINKLRFEDLAKSLEDATEAFKRNAAEAKRAANEYDILNVGMEGTNILNVKVGKTLGEVSDAGERARESLKTVARALIDQVKAGEKTEKQALIYIRQLGKDFPEAAKEMEEALRKSFINIAFSQKEVSKGMFDIINRLPKEWAFIYITLDTLRQNDLLAAFVAMEQEIAGRKKANEDLEILAAETEAQIKAIRKRALDDFLDDLDKKAEAQEKHLDKAIKEIEKAEEKRVKARKKTLDALKSLEEKVQEDLKAIRQKEYTDNEKLTEDLEAAREQLGKARKALAEADTETERQAALEQLEIARAMFRAIMDAAREASEETKKAAKASASVMSEAWDVPAKEATKYYSNIMTSTSEVVEGEARAHKKRTKADRKAAKDKGKIAEDAIKEIARIAKESPTKLVIKVDDALEELDVVDSALEDTATVAAEPKPVNVPVDVALEGLSAVDVALEDVDTKVAKERWLNLDVSAFIAAVQRAIDKIGALITRIAEIPKSITIKINYKSSGTSAGDNASLNDGTKAAGTGIKTLTSTITGGGGGGRGGSVKPAAVYNVGFTGTGSTTLPLSEKITEIKDRFMDLTKSLKEGLSYTIDFKGSGSTTTGLVDKLQQLIEKVAELIGQLTGLSGGFGNVEAAARKAYDVITKIGRGSWVEYIYLDEAGNTVKTIRIPYHEGGPVLSTGSADLEAGEYVSDKETVQKLGVGFFAGLKEKAQGFFAQSFDLVSGGFAMPQLAFGTGLQGLPYTGVFHGHKGEIVKSPVESDIERKGRPGNTYNITFAPQVMTGDRMAMRNAAIAFKEAIGQLDHQWGTA